MAEPMERRVFGQLQGDHTIMTNPDHPARYSADFKLRAVLLARKIGAVATGDRMEVPVKTVKRWIEETNAREAKARAGAFNAGLRDDGTRGEIKSFEAWSKDEGGEARRDASYVREAAITALDAQNASLLRASASFYAILVDKALVLSGRVPDELKPEEREERLAAIVTDLKTERERRKAAGA